jgi:hypothetical protein
MKKKEFKHEVNRAYLLLSATPQRAALAISEEDESDRSCGQCETGKEMGSGATPTVWYSLSLFLLQASWVMM